MLAAPMLKPAPLVHGSAKSSFRGLTTAFQQLGVSQSAVGRSTRLQVEASRICDLTGTKANNGYVVTFSHKRNKKLQQANLQYKKIYWPEGQRWVKLRVCTRALKTVEKRGLQVMANEAGIDLWKLPFEDARPQRLEWLAANPATPPMGKNSRKMKNPEKLAASKKSPLVARYSYGKIEYVRTDAI